MKRWTTRILICLLLGVVVNVGVAWQRSLYGYQFQWRFVHGTQAWIGNRPVYWPAYPVVISRNSLFGATMNALESGDMRYSQFTADFGLPVRSMRYQMHTVREHGTKTPVEVMTTPWVAGLKAGSDSTLPLRPIFPGFIINTLFYALICFALWFGPGMIRRRIRSARGRCIKCGYDLRGAPGISTSGAGGCPECGWGREDI